MRCRQHAPVTSSDPSIRWRLLHKMEGGKGNKDGKANLMVEGGRGNKDGKANLMVEGGRDNQDGRDNLMVDGKANLMVGGRGNKNSNTNQMKGSKVNRCSRIPGSDVLLNYRRGLRGMGDNRERGNEVGRYQSPRPRSSCKCSFLLFHFF
jgi:hypothetical protein